MFRCNYCNRNFTIKTNLYRHKRKSCPYRESNYCFNARKNRNLDTLVCEVPLFRCNDCNRPFTIKTNLYRHKRQSCTYRASICCSTCNLDTPMSEVPLRKSKGENSYTVPIPKVKLTRCKDCNIWRETNFQFRGRGKRGSLHLDDVYGVNYNEDHDKNSQDLEPSKRNRPPVLVDLVKSKKVDQTSNVRIENQDKGSSENETNKSDSELTSNVECNDGSLSTVCDKVKESDNKTLNQDNLPGTNKVDNNNVQTSRSANNFYSDINDGSHSPSNLSEISKKFKDKKNIEVLKQTTKMDWDSDIISKLDTMASFLSKSDYSNLPDNNAVVDMDISPKETEIKIKEKEEMSKETITQLSEKKMTALSLPALNIIPKKDIEDIAKLCKEILNHPDSGEENKPRSESEFSSLNFPDIQIQDILSSSKEILEKGRTFLSSRRQSVDVRTPGKGIENMLRRAKSLTDLSEVALTTADKHKDYKDELLELFDSSERDTSLDSGLHLTKEQAFDYFKIKDTDLEAAGDIQDYKDELLVLISTPVHEQNDLEMDEEIVDQFSPISEPDKDLENVVVRPKRRYMRLGDSSDEEKSSCIKKSRRESSEKMVQLQKQNGQESGKNTEHVEKITKKTDPRLCRPDSANKYGAGTTAFPNVELVRIEFPKSRKLVESDRKNMTFCGEDPCSSTSKQSDSELMTKAEYLRRFGSKKPVLPDISLSFVVKKRKRIEKRRNTFTCNAENEKILKKIDQKSIKQKELLEKLFGPSSDQENEPESSNPTTVSDGITNETSDKEVTASPEQTNSDVHTFELLVASPPQCLTDAVDSKGSEIGKIKNPTAKVTKKPARRKSSAEKEVNSEQKKESLKPTAARKSRIKNKSQSSNHKSNRNKKSPAKIRERNVRKRKSAVKSHAVQSTLFIEFSECGSYTCPSYVLDKATPVSVVDNFCGNVATTSDGVTIFESLIVKCGDKNDDDVIEILQQVPVIDLTDEGTDPIKNEFHTEENLNSLISATQEINPGIITLYRSSDDDQNVDVQAVSASIVVGQKDSKPPTEIKTDYDVISRAVESQLPTEELYECVPYNGPSYESDRVTCVSVVESLCANVATVLNGAIICDSQIVQNDIDVMEIDSQVPIIDLTYDGVSNAENPIKAVETMQEVKFSLEYPEMKPQEHQNNREIINPQGARRSSIEQQTKEAITSILQLNTTPVEHVQITPEQRIAPPSLVRIGNPNVTNLPVSAAEMSQLVQIFSQHVYFSFYRSRAQTLYENFLKSVPEYKPSFEAELALFTRDQITRLNSQSRNILHELFALNIMANINLESSANTLIDTVYRKIVSLNVPGFNKYHVYLLIMAIIEPIRPDLAKVPFFKALFGGCDKVIEILKAKNRSGNLMSQDQVNQIRRQIDMYNRLLEQPQLNAKNLLQPTELSNQRRQNTATLDTLNKTNQQCLVGSNRPMASGNLPTMNNIPAENTRGQQNYRSVQIPKANSTTRQTNNIPLSLHNQRQSSVSSNVMSNNPSVPITQNINTANNSLPAKVTPCPNSTCLKCVNKQNNVPPPMPPTQQNGTHASSQIAGNYIYNLAVASYQNSRQQPTSSMAANMLQFQTTVPHPASVPSQNQSSFTQIPPNLFQRVSVASNLFQNQTAPNLSNVQMSHSIQPSATQIGSFFQPYQNRSSITTLYHTSTNPPSGIHSSATPNFQASPNTRSSINIPSYSDHLTKMTAISGNNNLQKYNEQLLSESLRNSNMSQTPNASIRSSVPLAAPNISAANVNNSFLSNASQIATNSRLNQTGQTNSSNQFQSYSTNSAPTYMTNPTLRASANSYHLGSVNTADPVGKTQSSKTKSTTQKQLRQKTYVTKNLNRTQMGSEVNQNHQPSSVLPQNSQQVVQPQLQSLSLGVSKEVPHSSKQSDLRNIAMGSEVIQNHQPSLLLTQSYQPVAKSQLQLLSLGVSKEPHIAKQSDLRNIVEDGNNPNYAPLGGEVNQNHQSSLLLSQSSPPVAQLKSSVSAVSAEPSTLSNEDTFETVDLTWIDDLDDEQLQKDLELIYMKKEELDWHQGTDNSSTVPCSPVDSGISSPPQLVDENTTIYTVQKLCICSKSAQYFCICREAWYCGPKCQFTDWESHIKVCCITKDLEAENEHNRNYNK